MDNAVPTDSVLRRHYEASKSKPTPNAPQQNKNTSGGFMYWLKRLFGG